MKRIFLILSFAMAPHAFCAAGADSKNDVKSAAKKLAEKDSYSWTSTADGKPDLRMGPLEGKAEKGGFTYCKFTVGDNEIETAFKGTKGAIKRQSEWESTADLESNNAAWIARRLQAFKAPPAEAEELADQAKELKAGADGLYSGDLSADGVKELISRWRRNAEPAGAKGTVKFWVKDGLLTKYEFTLQGKVAGGNDQPDVEVDRTTTVVIKEVGATKVSVPEEAKKKLS